MNEGVRHIVIVGGGSAGWLCAGVLAATHAAAGELGVQVTLLESPEQAPIGVGEGTWPSMRDTLRRIGVSESALVRECDASFKQGSRFDGWCHGGDGDHYMHPFTLPVGYGDANLAAAWLAQHAALPFADLVGFQPHLCARGLAPKQATTPEYAAVANYAYHFDAGRFGPFLRTHCVEQLGVRHVPGHVTGVLSHGNGDIAAVQLRGQPEVAGDLFVDCSGLQSLLLGGHFGVGWVSQSSVLFCDSALALQVSYADAAAPIASATIATAQAHGWIWDIGLSSRRGIGHVYSSAHTSDDAAEAALRRHVARHGGPADPGTPRKLRFQPGYRAEFWHRNCVGIGLAAGFIEPLEASAIALVEMAAAMLADNLPRTRPAMDIVARRFNDAFSYRWQRVIEFLKLHYALTQRTDSDFWRDHVRPESMPPRLQELLTLWRHQAPSRHDFPRIEEVFPAASWQYVLYGMGFRPAPGALARRSDEPGAAQSSFREAAELTRRMLAALPDNRTLIAHIQRHGLPRI